MSQRSDNGAVRDTTAVRLDGDQASEGDAAAPTTSVIRSDDLAEFRQATRVEKIGAIDQTEDDRVTPSAPTPSPFRQSNTRTSNTALPPGDPAKMHSAPTAAEQRGLGALRAAVAREFRRASWPKRATVILLPFAIGLYSVSTIRRPVPPAKRANTARAASVPSAQPLPSRAVDPNPSSTPAPKASSSPVLASSDGDAHVAGPTLQRRAVDAFATGNFARAATLYRRLAAENSSQPVYAAAAQIASDKANGLGHE